MDERPLRQEKQLEQARPTRTRDDATREFDWLRDHGLSTDEIERLLPTLPGGMTTARSFYVNSLISGQIFRGQEQVTIPMTAGRWFLIPLEIINAHPSLYESPLALARAPGLLPDEGPRSFAAWTAGG